LILVLPPLQPEHLSLCGCIRRPTRDVPGPMVTPYASRRRLPKGRVRPQRIGEMSVLTPFHSHYITHRGTCGKTRLVPQNCRPKIPRPRLEPVENGGTKCV
jgi:hypothetical protein